MWDFESYLVEHFLSSIKVLQIFWLILGARSSSITSESKMNMGGGKKKSALNPWSSPGTLVITS